MIIAVTIVHYIICIILIVVILLQAGKGKGLTGGGSFGNDSMQSVFGTRTTQFMTKITTFSAVAFIVTCLTIGMLTSAKSKSLLIDANKDMQIPLASENLPEGVTVTRHDGVEEKKVVVNATKKDILSKVAKKAKEVQ